MSNALTLNRIAKDIAKRLNLTRLQPPNKPWTSDPWRGGAWDIAQLELPTSVSSIECRWEWIKNKVARHQHAFIRSNSWQSRQTRMHKNWKGKHVAEMVCVHGTCSYMSDDVEEVTLVHACLGLLHLLQYLHKRIVKGKKCRRRHNYIDRMDDAVAWLESLRPWCYLFIKMFAAIGTTTIAMIDLTRVNSTADHTTIDLMWCQCCSLHVICCIHPFLNMHASVCPLVPPGGRTHLSGDEFFGRLIDQNLPCAETEVEIVLLVRRVGPNLL